jgi:hypothetical protein
MTTATAPLRDIRFTPNPVVPPKKKPSIQAVDNRTFPQDPPPPDPNGPLKPVKTGEDVKGLLDTLPRGDNKQVRTLKDPADIYRLFDSLTRNASDATHPTYDGPRRALPDGTVIAFRPTSTYGGPTIDVTYPDRTEQFVHLPIVTSVPDLPQIADPAPVTVPPAQVTDPGSAPTLPTSVATPSLPPWLQNPSPPGFQITPGRPVMVPWDWGLTPEPWTPVQPPQTPVAAPSSPPFTLPSLPQPAPVAPQDAAAAGTATAAAGGIGGLLLLALLFQN